MSQNAKSKKKKKKGNKHNNKISVNVVENSVDKVVVEQKETLTKEHDEILTEEAKELPTKQLDDLEDIVCIEKIDDIEKTESDSDIETPNIEEEPKTILDGHCVSNIIINDSKEYMIDEIKNTVKNLLNVIEKQNKKISEMENDIDKLKNKNSGQECYRETLDTILSAKLDSFSIQLLHRK